MNKSQELKPEIRTQPEFRIQQLMVPANDRDRVDFYLAKELGVHPSEISFYSIERMSLDARKRGRPLWSCQVAFRCSKPLKHPRIEPWTGEKETLENDPLVNTLDLPNQVIVVGAGPAGLWAALTLARKGYKVQLHEQGQPVEKRYLDIRHFLKGRLFNDRSNVLFGEGGAGAFSDGKLTSRTRGPFVRQVLEDIALAGGGEEVRYLSKAHIGTDRLYGIIRNIRQWLVELGVDIHFDSKLTDIEIQNGQIYRAAFNDSWQSCEALILATGHSSRDLYELLWNRGVALEAKPFAVGVRVEHPQHLIDRRHLGPEGRSPWSGAAEYVLTAKTCGGSSTAYSFCMCPGGVLIPCASEAGGFATNGMSYSRRNSPFANAGIVVPVPVMNGVWQGVEYQRKLERTAFEIGGSNYTAPAQTVKSFLAHKSSAQLPKSSFPTGLVPTNHWDWMDKDLCQSMAEGFLDFEKKIPGWIENGLMISPETRTSSPLRIVRHENLESINIRGLYPLGEGAGYAGGITTSAADGVRLGNMAKPKNLLGVKNP